MKQLFLRYGVIAAAVSAMALLGPATQAGMSLDSQATTAAAIEAGQREAALPLANPQADPAHGQPTSVINLAPGEREAAAEPAAGIQAWPTPNRRSYHITASCRPYAAAIRQGAAAWSGLTEGAGTPVECTNSYITGCGGSNVVGCNWGRGQRIALFMRGVRDGALLAAHEFGHNWFGHSNHRCASWASAQHVMAPAMCG